VHRKRKLISTLDLMMKMKMVKKRKKKLNQKDLIKQGRRKNKEIERD
jgi:activator of HSP90 ATPase